MEAVQNGAAVATVKQRIIDELSLYIRSQYPLLMIVSHEEERVVSAIEELGESLKREVFIWSSSRGLYSNNPAKQAAPVKNPQSFTIGLEDIRRYRGEAIFVVLDGHKHTQPDDVTRILRDMEPALEKESKTIIFIGVDDKVPPELQKDIYVLHFPFPDANELLGAVHELGENGMSEEEHDQVAQAALGMTLREAQRAFRRSKTKDGKLTIEDIEMISGEKQRLINQNRALLFYSYNETLDHVGGLDSLKQWVCQRKRAFSREAREYGLPLPKGILILGVQGCGKSLSCKAIANLWQMPLLRLDLGAVYGSYVGMSEENMRNVIKITETVAPCVLWIDEIEKGLAGIGSSDMSDAGTSSRVFSTILTWMQERKAPVFIAATANRVAGLPPELLRRGRLDEIFFVDLPTEAEKNEIFKIHLRKHRRDPGKYAVARLVEGCVGFSGAEIEQSIINALYQAFDEGTDLSNLHLARAITDVIPISQTMAEEIQQLQRWAHDRARPASLVETGAPIA